MNYPEWLCYFLAAALGAGIGGYIGIKRANRTFAADLTAALNQISQHEPAPVPFSPQPAPAYHGIPPQDEGRPIPTAEIT